MVDVFKRPWVAVGIAVLFVALYFSIIGALAPDAITTFFHVGPGNKPENTTTFIGMNIDTWSKTIGVYCIALLSSLVWSYYQTYGWQLASYTNRAIKEVAYSKASALAFMTFNPFLGQLMATVMFFTSLTVQFQFIFFEALGSLIGSYSYALKRISEIEFNVPDTL